MALKFMLGDGTSIAAFYEWSIVMYEDGWRLRVSDLKDLPAQGWRGRPINCQRMIHDSYRWILKDHHPVSHSSTLDLSPKSEPSFVSCVWDFSSVLQARIESGPNSIDLEFDNLGHDEAHLEEACWSAAKPTSRVCALDLACLHENYDYAKLLLEAGADITSHLALSFGIRAQRADLVQLLLEHGAPLGTQGDIDMWNQAMEWPTGFGSNPLHQAVIVGSPKMIDMLSQHGADPKLRIEGVSALDLAKG